MKLIEINLFIRITFTDYRPTQQASNFVNKSLYFTNQLIHNNFITTQQRFISIICSPNLTPRNKE